MITISKYNKEFNFIEKRPSIDEIFNDNYKVIEKGVKFEPNDIIIDIGANIGAFSILLAKLYSFITVYAIEPVAETFIKLCQNIQINNLTNIIPINITITGGEKISHIIYAPPDPGGASSFVTEINNLELKEIYVGGITLDDLLIHFNITKCKLLKIDCEGAEYNILYNSTLLNRIIYLVGEFHDNDLLRNNGYYPDKLADYCSKFVKRVLFFEYCKMHE